MPEAGLPDALEHFLDFLLLLLEQVVDLGGSLAQGRATALTAAAAASIWLANGFCSLAVARRSRAS